MENLNYANGINFDEVTDKLYKANIDCYDCVYSIPESIPSIGIPDVNDFIALVSAMGIKVVFYSFGYYYKEDYEITDELILEYANKTVLNNIRELVDEYNEKLDKIDFNIPYKFICFFIKDNVSYMLVEGREWLEDFNVMSPNIIIEDMIEKAKDKISETQAREKEELERLEEQLKEYILNDEEFQVSTNQSLRNSYTKKLLKKPMFAEYEKCFMNPNGNFASVDVFSMVETLWRLYKNKK